MECACVRVPKIFVHVCVSMCACVSQVTANVGRDGVTNYAKGHIPNSPVNPKMCNGSAVEEIELVSLGHSYLRFTVLPWLAPE